MAVLEINHRVHKYIGASTDIKPTAAINGTTAGSTFYAQDTGIMYITYDGTNWVEKDTVVRLETSPTIDIGDVTLLAGTALVGKVGIDQTTPGTTNAVVEASAAAIKTAIEAANTALQTGGISQTQFASMVTALQLIDNFISGSRGLVTEDNSGSIKTAVEAINTALQTSGISQVQFAAMVTALQLIDNMISGSEAQVDVVAALPAGTNLLGKVSEPVTVETPFTGNGDIAVAVEKIAPGAVFKLTEIQLHLASAPTGANPNLVITKDDGVDAVYDLVILTLDLVANAVTDLVIKPNMVCKATDVITAAWTNTNTIVYGIIFKHQLL